MPPSEFPAPIEFPGSLYAGVINAEGEVAWRPAGTESGGNFDDPDNDSPPDDGGGDGNLEIGDGSGDSPPPIDGGGSVETPNSGGGEGWSDPSSGTLPSYPVSGDKYCASIRTPRDGGRSELWYGVQDSSNLYFIGVDSTDDVVDIGYYDGGTKTTNDSLSATIYDGTVYDIVLTWRSDGYQVADIDQRQRDSPGVTLTEG